MLDTGKKDREKNPVLKPMITNYNLHIGGVDKVIRQLHGLYTLGKLQMVQKTSFQTFVF